MYPDFIYDLINAGSQVWVLIAIGYAIFDYLFNLIMCMITGGVQNLRRRNRKNDWLSRYRIFVNGGLERIKEFRSDSLSWLWPLTVLAIPIALYGITRNSIETTLHSFTVIGINLSNYQFLSQSSYVQFLVWLVASLEGLITVYRYRYQRSKPTFFSNSIVYSKLRVILFNTPIAYAVLNIIFITLSFSFTFYKILMDDSIVYNLFHPDQMYGLKTSYNTIIGISLVLTVISFLPTVILLRERGERYNKIYRLGFYSGIIATFILTGSLIIQFGQRLSDIKQIALQSDLLSPLSTSAGDIQTLTALEYYNVATNFPDGFPFPTWLSTLFIIRGAILGYELFEIFSTKAKKISIRELLKTLTSKL